MPALLTIEGVTKRFGGLTALADVSFAVKQDTIHGIIGPNGAGKTTLLNVIAGDMKPTHGRVVFRGRDIVGHPTHRRIFLGIARSFQLTQLLLESSVGENVALGFHSRARSGMLDAMIASRRDRRENRVALQAAEEALEYVGLDVGLNSPASALAYGHRKLLEIARALISRPALLLLDEPAAGMNEAERRHLLDVVNRIRRDGVTALIIEHHMDIVMALSDTVTVLAQGEKIGEGSPMAIQKDPVVIEAYLGPATDDFSTSDS